MKTILFAGLWLLTMSAVIAGGTSVEGKITNFSGERGNYFFHFEQTEKGYELIRGCPSFDVHVQYGRVPWYSWLPFVETSHPTYEQTETAAKILQASQAEGRLVNFGYMGSGLIASEGTCTFTSKGLLPWQVGGYAILSFYNPV